MSFTTWIIKKIYGPAAIEEDPVRGCDVYKDKAGGSCAHVDGMLCDYPNCTILREHRECNQASDCTQQENTPVAGGIPWLEAGSGDNPYLYQYRFYDDNPHVAKESQGWSEWKTVELEQLTDIREYISWGKKYQIRALREIVAEGYAPPEA